MVYLAVLFFNKLRRAGLNLITKLIFLTCFFYFFSIPFYSAELTMQLYVFDNEFNQPLETMTDTTIVYSVVDNDGHEYFSTESEQTISQGVLNIVFDVDLSSQANLYVFDKNDLNLKIELLSDELLVPFTSSLIAVLSEISDRTIQINDSEIVSIDYDNMSINIGPDASSDYEVNIDGILRATRFIGRGEAIYNALGAGLSDFHSLEVIFSRTCSPVNQEPDCIYGEDVLFVDNHPYVGIYNTTPELPLDVEKIVIFKEGEYDVGALKINRLTLNQEIMAWDHQFGAFKSGYVSKTETVSIDSFAHASTGIGTDIVTSGLYSLGLGGQDNTVKGDYSAILGGENNTIIGDYGVLLGSQDESVNLGYVASVGGRGNVVSSNYAVLVSAKQNAMAGAYQTVVGEQNLVNGNDVFIYGNTNQVSSNDVIVMGNSNVINNGAIWSVNMTDADLLMSNNSNQVIWLADNGVSINTSNISESLNVSGGISALSFSGNGSLLTNVSLVDKYWLMNGYEMINDSNRLGINTAEANENIINLKNGILVGESLFNTPGTLSYDGNTLLGYAESGAYLLSSQNQDTAYTVSNVLEKNGDEIALSFIGVLKDEFIVYDGISWQYSEKNTWEDFSNELYHERPISFWGSDKYLGRVTVMHSTQNVLTFLSDTNDSGLSFRTGNQTDKSRSIVIGFNYNVQTGEHYDALRSGYKFEFDSLSGGLSLSNGVDDALLEIESDGTLNFFNSFTNLSLNISSPSQVSYFKVDDESLSSVFKTISYESYPMLEFEQSGQLTLQSSNNGDINFAILPQSYLLKENENRLRFSALGEMILSDEDAVQLGQVMLTHPDGDLLVDHGKEIGVFESFGNRMLGVALNYNQIDFFHSNDDSVVINEFGLGINNVPSSVLAINAGQEAADIVLDGSVNGGESRFEFSRNSANDLWGIKTNQGEQGSGGLVIENKLDQFVLSFSDGQKININNSETNFRDINIQGDVSQIGSLLKMSNSMDISDANDIVFFDDDVITFKSIDDFGLGFLVGNSQLLEIANGVISIGGQSRSINPTKNLYVDTGAYINGSLYYFNEKIENKRIKSSSGIHFDQVKENTAQTIQFDYDTGFEVTSTGINEVTLSFKNHFSSMNSTRLDQSSVSDNDGITPQGVDVMGFEGSFISVIADNVLGQGNELGEMDSLSFFNDGMNGADIDGDLVVLGSLNLFDESGEPQSLIGNVSQMENFPFPWQHIVTENSTVVDYEYVITENVGIGTSSPIYPLEVNGTTMVDELISSTIRVSNNIITNAASFPIIAYDNIYVDLNKSQQVTNELLTLNRLYIMDQKMGLNGTNLNYFMSFFPNDLGVNSQLNIQAQNTAIFNVPANTFELNQNGDLSVLSDATVTQMEFISNVPSLTLSNDRNISLYSHLLPLNTLDISGNIVVGSSLSGTLLGLDNAVMIESKLGVNTDNPQAPVDIYGAMVVGNSSNYMGNIYGLSQSLVIEDKLYLEEYDPLDVTYNVQINGGISVDGGLYFNKSSTDESHELSFIDTEENRMRIGYAQSVDSRNLAIQGNLFLDLTPQAGYDGLYLSSTGKVALGHDLPFSQLHVKKDGVQLIIDAQQVGDGDAQIKFESIGKGIIGYDNAIPNQFVFTDGDVPETVGAQLSIDQTGQVDIGYNVANLSTSQPTHDVALDVLQHVNASLPIMEQDQVLTHMPEGSIVMWSGWTADLPEGWLLCTGIDDAVNFETNECNFLDYFVVGKDVGDTLNLTVSGSSHSIVLTTTGSLNDYSHSHTGSHDHLGFTEASHDHGDLSSPQSIDSFYTDYSYAGGTVVSLGDLCPSDEQLREDYGAVYSEIYYNYISENCNNENNTQFINPSISAYSPLNNGEHRHEVNIDHGHTVSLPDLTHNHTLDNKEHTHSNANHQHEINNEPEYYSLAFIYLKGEQ